MNKYQREKEKARKKAMEWQISEKSVSWSELAEATAYFEKLGKRYGLTAEFRYNGII